MNDTATWLMLQLADSAFPTGGFAHSAGLEAAAQFGEVENRADFAHFVSAHILQTGSGALPFVRSAHESPAQLIDIDHHCDTFLTSHVANRVSRLQGRAFIATSRKSFDRNEIGKIGEQIRKGEIAGHQAPCFGAALSALEIPLESSLTLYLHLSLRSVLSAAVRLGIVGPIEAQQLQAGRGKQCSEVIRMATAAQNPKPTTTAPVFELLGTLQDQLYSRLFQS